MQKIQIDMGGVKFELFSNNKNEMDKWSEALGLSVRYCKEITESLYPRSLEK